MREGFVAHRSLNARNGLGFGLVWADAGAAITVGLGGDTTLFAGRMWMCLPASCATVQQKNTGATRWKPAALGTQRKAGKRLLMPQSKITVQVGATGWQAPTP